MSARWESAGLHLSGNRTQSRSMLKKATFSPAQPWRAKTRRSASKAAAVFPTISNGWLGRSSIAHVERAPSERARSASRRTTGLPVPSFFSILLRSRRKFMWQERHVLLLKGEMDDQEDDPHADRRIGNIEGRPMIGLHIDIKKIDHLAIP